jgi:peptide/nickel transport system permease protein
VSVGSWLLAVLRKLGRGQRPGVSGQGSLAIGATCLTVLGLACGLGPLLTLDATEIADPRAAALLPPLAVRHLVRLADTAPLLAEQAERVAGGWRVTRLGEAQTVADARVTGVERRLFVLGTDAVGRDVLARVLAGGRASLGVGALGLLVAVGLGALVGLASGLAGGVLDGLLMRLTDALLAVPLLFLLVFLAAVLRPSAVTLAVVLGLSSWMGVARLVRGQVKSLKERDWVLALRGMGLSESRIALRHLLPNALSPVSQDAALRLGDLILVEASMSFLGLGVQPPAPSWGNLVADGQAVLAQAWWLTAIPSALVALTVVAAALTADGLQALAGGDV